MYRSFSSDRLLKLLFNRQPANPFVPWTWLASFCSRTSYTVSPLGGCAHYIACRFWYL